MSRIANSPIEIPASVEIKLGKEKISVKGAKGTLELDLHPGVEVKHEDTQLTFASRGKDKSSRAMSGTLRALVNNMVQGVSNGWQKKLQLQGVGYRAQVKGNSLNLQLGFSHPVDYALPEGISVEVPSQTEIVVSGIDKQLVGQVSAEIRSYRPPEPYKGKGVRYNDERVRRKEAKKK